MMNFENFPIQRKLIAIILLTSTIVLALTSFAYLNVEIFSFRTNLVEEITTLSDVIGQNLTAVIRFDRPEEAKTILESIQTVPNVNAAWVYRIGSSALLDTEPDDERPKLFTYFQAVSPEPDASNEESQPELSKEIYNKIFNNLSKSGSHFGAQTLVVWSPVELNNQVIGMVVIESSLDDLYKRLLWFLAYILGIFVLALGAAYFVSRMLQGIISNPILKLSDAMSSISRDHLYSMRMEGKREDEIGVLERGFNEMVTQIQKRDDALQRHRAMLEQLVEQRTSELTETNKDLEEAVEQLKKAKDVAEAANKAKSQFLANMSHEIRTPLNGILGSLDLLRTGELSVQQKHLLDISRYSGDALLQIINDVLDFSRIESGKIKLEFIETDIISLVEDTLDQQAERAYRKGLELTSYLPKLERLCVLADPLRLRQILLNLLSNAVKFTEKGEVSLNLEVLEEDPNAIRLRFSVEDTGIGVDPTLKDRLFKSFTQADETTTRRFGGAGLGLAISKHLVELLGGTIDFNIREKRGTTFWFDIPFQYSSPPSVQTRTKDYIGKHALVIDPNPKICRMVKYWLDYYGVNTDYTQTDLDGWNRIQSNIEKQTPYDFIFVPITLFEIVNHEITQAFLKPHDAISSRLIIMTKMGKISLPDELADFSSAVFLEKPIRQSRLLHALQEAKKDIKSQTKTQPELIEPTQASPSASRGIVLLVEDNRINQTIMKKMIEHLGYIVRIAPDGKEAIQGFRSSLFDAILMDCQMPVMDGYQAAAQIRQLENESQETARIPIIAVTAHAIKGDKEKCIKAGMDDYISKPFTLEQLEEKLHQWVEDPQTPEIQSKQSSSTEPPEVNRPEPDNLDLSMWDKIQALQSGPNDSLLHDVMENYINDAQKAIQNLQTSIQNNEAKSIESIAHTLKSSSANVGAMRLSLHCKELESNSHNNSLENASVLYQAIANEYATVKERILEHLEKEPYAR